MFLVISPFYVWKSGRPQPADGVLAIALVYLLIGHRPALPAGLRKAVIGVFLFAIYAATVNLIWGALLLDSVVQKVGALGFASFYFFNAAVFAACVLLYIRHRAAFFAVTAWGTIGALGVQLVLLMIRGGSGLFREKLFFNNPNQLGYYALLSAGIVAFCYRPARVPLLVAAAALAVTTLFAASSLSKAALVGTGVTACVAALRKPALLFATILIILVGMAARDPSELINRVTIRMQDIGTQGDDTLEGRGYTRIASHPQYLVLGAGEVGLGRFGGYGGEMHSSWGTVLFCYGAVGAGLLVAFFWAALRHLRLMDLLYPVPIFWYGVTHQGLRFRLFWVFIALLCVAAFHARALEARRARASAVRGSPRA